MLRALIFDFDGLILDTESPEWEAWRSAYAQHGVELPRSLWLRNIGTHGAFDPVGHLESLLGCQLERARLEELRRAEHERLCEGLELLPGVERVMAVARGKGLRLAVASSSSRRWVSRWLSHHALAFDAVCTRDDVARVKPAPDLYLAAAVALGCAPAECLALEDSPNGLAAALAAGMRSIVVPCALTADCEFPGAEARLRSLLELSIEELMGISGPQD
jgi:HAD superfamily hydrolase (TIGR01509 family)